MEKSLIILKPDTVQRGLIGQVLARIEQRGYKIVALQMTILDKAILDQHYAHISDKPFYPNVVDFMTSGPAVLGIVEGPNAVNGMRQLCGATNPAEASMGTIRADFANTVDFNIIHASDSVENAEIEITRFFGNQ